MAVIKPGQLSSGPYNISGSFSGSFQGDGSNLINVPTQSFETGSFVLTSSFDAFTGSYNTGSFTGSFTGSLLGIASTASYVLNAVSSSYAGIANSVNDLNQNVFVSGALTVLGDATFYGSSSFVYVTASQLAVSASFISVNVFEPAQRFGGLIVYDSGSSQATASLAWDSLHNHWIYQNVSGATYTGGMFLSGPRNTGSLGDEPTLTKWFIPRGDGGDHLDNTQIYSSGSTHIVTGSLTVTQGVTGSLEGTASYATQALSASFAPVTPPFPFTGSAQITGSLTITGSLNGNGTTTLNGAATFGNTVRMVTSANEILGIQNNFSTSNTFSGLNITRPSAGGSYFNGNGNLYLLYHSQTKTNTYIQSSAEIYSRGLKTIYFADGASNQHEFHVGNPAILGAATTASLKMAVNSSGVQVTGSLGVTGSISLRRSSGNGLMFLDQDGRIAIGYNANITNHQVSDLSIGYNASIGAGAGGDRIAIGRGATTSLYYGTAIGLSANVNSNGGLALGCGASTTGGDAVNPQIAIGMGVGTSAPYSIMIGNVYSLSTTAINNIANSFMIHLGGSGNGNYQNFFVNSNSNIVLRRGTQLTSSAHFDTTATNTLTLHSGSIPATTISGALQFYAATGSISNNVRPHFRTGNGTTVWLGDESRLFNVTASNISASDITASSLTVPSGSITITTGSITMPNRPAFRVTGAGGGKVAVTTLSGSYLNVDYQQGSGWDNSTGTFTAPIAGLYQVNVVVRTNSNSLGVISQLIVYKNNTGGTTGTPQIMVEFGTNTSMNHAGGSTISKLEVGDTLKMVVASGEISFDANDNFSVAYIG